MMRLKPALPVLLILLGALALGSCASADARERPKAVMGVINARDYSFADQGPLLLQGTWEWWWMPNLSLAGFGDQGPDRNLPSLPSTPVEIPGYWTGLELPGKPAGNGQGWALFKITVLLPYHEESRRQLALEIPEIRSAYRLWHGATLLSGRGELGRSETEEVPALGTETVVINVEGSSIDFYVMVSNFHDKDGGMNLPILLGSPDQILGAFNLRTVLSGGIMASLFLFGLYHILIYVMRPKEFYNFLFGMFCVAFGLKAGFDGNKIILDLLPYLSWDNYLRFWILLGVAAGPFYLWFLHELYPQETNRIALWAFTAYMGAYAVMLVITGPEVFEYFDLPYYVVAIALILYGMGIQIFALVRGREYALGTLLAGLVVGIATLHDIRIGLGLEAGTVIYGPFGLLVFVLFQAWIIAYKYTDGFHEITRLGLELKRNNQTLEFRIQERTKELENRLEEIKTLSTTDHLTGAANRRRIDAVIQDEINRAQRTGRGFSILLFDLDHFKSINDRYGHGMGDMVLRNLAVLVLRLLRKIDVLGRWGGDEFIVILPDTDADAAFQAAERIRQAVMGTRLGAPGNCTTSLGWASWRPDDTMDSIVARADKGLYAAKSKGRNCIVSLE